MRVIVIISLIGMVLLGCKEEKESSYETGEHHEELVSKALTLNDSLNTDTTFLNFRFSMSKKDVLGHVRKLVKEGKLNDKVQYTFSTSSGNAIADVIPKYYQDTLYKLILAVNSENTYNSPRILLYDLSDLLDAKYGSPTSIQEPLLEDGGYVFTYLKGTMEIYLMTGIYEDVRMTYTDIKRALIAEIEEEKVDSLKQIENQSDL